MSTCTGDLSLEAQLKIEDERIKRLGAELRCAKEKKARLQLQLQLNQQQGVAAAPATLQKAALELSGDSASAGGRDDAENVQLEEQEPAPDEDSASQSASVASAEIAGDAVQGDMTAPSPGAAVQVAVAQAAAPAAEAAARVPGALVSTERPEAIKLLWKLVAMGEREAAEAAALEEALRRMTPNLFGPNAAVLVRTHWNEGYGILYCPKRVTYDLECNRPRGHPTGLCVLQYRRSDDQATMHVSKFSPRQFSKQGSSGMDWRDAVHVLVSGADGTVSPWARYPFRIWLRLNTTRA